MDLPRSWQSQRHNALPEKYDLDTFGLIPLYGGDASAHRSGGLKERIDGSIVPDV